MTKKILTFAELEAAINELSDVEDELDVAILPPEDYGGISDDEDLDLNNLNDYEIPKDVAGFMELFDYDWDSEDELPLSYFKNANVMDQATTDAKWKIPHTTECNQTLPIDTERVKIEELYELLGDKSPVQLFEEIFDEHIYEIILTQSNLYAAQNNRDFRLDMAYLKRFIGILLFTGYNCVPQEDLYWTQSPDIHFPIIRETMPRSMYRKIKINLHLADNDTIDASDKLYKVRHFLQAVSQNCSKFKIFSHALSIDESMWPYHGRHTCKMFIKGKPIRFGYKIWCLCSSAGYVYKFIPYAGKSATFSKTLGLGQSVVLDLLQIVPEPQHHKIYFDNFFTSHSLMVKLSDLHFFATGTVRENRTAKCPLTGVKAFKKKDRGYFETAYDENNKIIALRWNDNATVSLLSNFEGAGQIKEVNRRSRNLQLTIPCPEMISSYNKYMGGVDLMDRFMSQYRVKVKGKKWWWPYFSNCIDLALSNAWCLHKRLALKSMPLLDFRRRVALDLLKTPITTANPTGKSGRPSKLGSIPQHVNERHDIVKIGSDIRRRCRECGSHTYFKCGKCSINEVIVPLHLKCSSSYHQQ